VVSPDEPLLVEPLAEPLAEPLTAAVPELIVVPVPIAVPEPVPPLVEEPLMPLAVPVLASPVDAVFDVVASDPHAASAVVMARVAIQRGRIAFMVVSSA
jgi:hypothetical protein